MRAPYVSLLPFPRLRAALACVLVAALAGCASVREYLPSVDSLAVYKIDVNQGNYLSQDMVDRLKPGMTRQQVRLVLGTPLVTSAFRDNRWDYVYEFSRQGRLREHRNFTVWFADDKLARWEGDEMPQSVVELNRAAGDKSLQGVPGDDGKTLLERIKGVFKRDGG
jgi:outer membrane protein assembly factor BamE (lipoprotein component of BamABCDE complex)